MEEKFDSIKAEIPLPATVYVLGRLFAENRASLFAVGGAIRDFLYSVHHGGVYSPKDVDLATEVQPSQVLKILNSPEAKLFGIKSFPKGEAFGVISAVINGEEYEIATFREDGNYSDGRRPDSVSFSTPAKDAQRRDLTYNALFYDIDGNEIRDYNLDSEGQGQGLKDIQNLIARPVGNARDRFQEDKLRIPRLIRFFSRFNPGNIQSHLDVNILEAIKEFKDLQGVSPERISAEFISGLQKSLDTAKYIENYAAVGLIPAVFRIININLEDLEPIKQTKSIAPVLAWLMRDNDPQLVRNQLNQLKYSKEVTDSVSFLLKLLRFDLLQIIQLLKYRDLYKQLDSSLQKAAKESLEEEVLDFARIIGREIQLKHFLNYQPQAKSQDFMHLDGIERGIAMRNTEKNAYEASLQGI